MQQVFALKGGFLMAEKKSRVLYPHPFSRAYWRDAASEFRDVRILIFAALIIALRLVLKSVKIPVGPSLNINVQFFVNALGSMVFGPVVAVLGGVVSDTLGYLLFPSGPYFPGFMLTEAAGALVFALFLYRAEITPARVILSRFCVNFFVNVVLQTPVMMLYYRMVLGKSYAWFDLPRIVKNLVLFPFESVLLILFLRYAVPPLSRLGFVRSKVDSLTLTRRNIFLLIALSLVSAAAAWLYLMYR